MFDSARLTKSKHTASRIEIVASKRIKTNNWAALQLGWFYTAKIGLLHIDLALFTEEILVLVYN